MAYSPSPQRSPTMASSAGRPHEQHFTPTPPPQPLSKRDKRRGALSEKLNDLTASFSQNRDGHYRQQLQALQVDMTLIMRADPYDDSPLDDSGDEIADMVAAAMGGGGRGDVGGGQPGQRRPEPDGSALAGRWYSRFVEEVNNAAEGRDVELTMLENNYERTLHELHTTNRYKIQLAQEEHRQLSRTLRERLVQSVAQRKARLMREKEQLDIADSNALLLHPTQFSITNPASPGGLPHNRKTRHTRHRPGDGDDAAGADGSHKRKRKVAADDNDVGSPGPAVRAMDTGTASPYRDTRARLVAGQSEAPLYSIERLFTEKELAMHLNHAHVAAHNYFAELKNHGPGGDAAAAHAAPRADDEDGTASAEAATAHEADGDDEAALAAPEMERAANQSHHATRSTRNGAASASALNLLGDVAVSEKNAGLAASAPIILPSTFITKTGLAPPPPPLSSEEADEDVARIQRLVRAPAGTTDQRLLDDLCAPLGTVSYHKGLMPAGVLAASAAAAAAAGTGAGLPMSAQSSTGAPLSELGGVPMSRHGEGSSTGQTMKRSASGAGLGGTTALEGKRMRNR
ncbi:MAG: hypothetical protein M1832_005437 [Thelocarpon impressellum]|nr:MAG: hypothetical protein M1832_005437 [Thelocarpon impressellum]